MAKRSKREQQLSRQQLNLGKRQPRSKVCVYCGKRPAVKSEHVVGKVFFHKMPNDMVTVPSCNECDSGRADGGDCDFHNDEEYVRIVLVKRIHASQHPVARSLLATVDRSILRSARMRQIFSGPSRRVIFKDPKGILFPGYVTDIQVDIHRIRRVIKKIVRGLYYAVEQELLPADYAIDVAPDISEKEVEGLLDGFGQRDSWSGYKNKVFMYKTQRRRSDPLRTDWLMVFYSYFPILAHTRPPDSSHPTE